MAVEETKEQQQIYNIFRSCIYIILIFEIIVNLPIGVDNPISAFLLKLLTRFRIFNSPMGCKIMEIICVLITCTGTKAKKELKFNMKTMVIYPIVIGFVCTLACLCFRVGQWGGYMMGIS